MAAEPTYPTTMTRAQWERLATEQQKRNDHEAFRSVAGRIRAGVEKREGDPVTLDLPWSVLGHLTEICFAPGLYDLGKSLIYQAGKASKAGQ